MNEVKTAKPPTHASRTHFRLMSWRTGNNMEMWETTLVRKIPCDSKGSPLRSILLNKKREIIIVIKDITLF